jgi:FtsP/CotA-like multicopper oxidase with cupredoxin domain
MSRVGFKFSISHHILRVVSRQGLQLQPFLTNEIALFPGDRYDVIVEATQPIAEYKIRVQITGCDNCQPDGSNNQPNNGYVSWAALRYDGAVKMSADGFSLKPTDEAGSPLIGASYNDHRVAPAHPTVPPVSSRAWTLNLTSERFWVENDIAPHRKWFFNGREFSGMMMQTPLLYRVLRGEKFSATEDLIFTANDGEVIDFIFNAQHNQDHPCVAIFHHSLASC